MECVTWNHHKRQTNTQASHTDTHTLSAGPRSPCTSPCPSAETSPWNLWRTGCCRSSVWWSGNSGEKCWCASVSLLIIIFNCLFIRILLLKCRTFAPNNYFTLRSAPRIPLICNLNMYLTISNKNCPMADITAAVRYWRFSRCLHICLDFQSVE